VTPDKGELAVGASMQVSVEYYSKQIGEHVGELTLHYDTGKLLRVFLFCNL
jgi:hypothetical protein